MSDFYLTWPIYPPHNRHMIIQRFAENPKLYLPHGLPGHDGLDFATKYGQTIIAPCPGEIYASGQQQAQGLDHNLGLHIRIRFTDEEGQEWRVALGHLSSVCADIGDIVRRGQVIGLAGNTGFVRPRPSPSNPKAGTHLHLGLCKVGDGAAGWPHDLVNPLLWLR